jgi:hypothetical protein
VALGFGERHHDHVRGRQRILLPRQRIAVQNRRLPVRPRDRRGLQRSQLDRLGLRGEDVLFRLRRVELDNVPRQPDRVLRRNKLIDRCHGHVDPAAL